MKVLIISDTHRSLRNFYEAVDREDRVDQLLHLGDVEGDEEEICAYAGCPASAAMTEIMSWFCRASGFS